MKHKEISKNRNIKIIKVSIIGIITNIFLSVFKMIVGFVVGSIAIILDAVNNISDVASSTITIIGTKLSSKEPDKEHPFGHGRGEYLTSLVIAIIILYAGFTSLIESIKKIINPITPEYNLPALIIVVVAIFVKIILGIYVHRKGIELKSDSLINSGRDAKLDALISFSTLVAAILYITSNVSTEAYLGVLISIIIIHTGINMLKEGTSSVLGERVDKELVDDITKTILKHNEVHGVYDLVLNNYGPNSYTGSLHIEILDTMNADDIDKLERIISEEIYKEYNIILTAIGIYSVNTKNKKVIEIKENINNLLSKYENILQTHGLYIDEKEKIIRFDMVISFEEKEPDKLYKKVHKELSEVYNDYKIIIQLDNDISVSN